MVPSTMGQIPVEPKFSFGSGPVHARQAHVRCGEGKEWLIRAHLYTRPNSRTKKKIRVCSCVAHVVSMSSPKTLRISKASWFFPVLHYNNTALPIPFQSQEHLCIRCQSFPTRSCLGAPLPQRWQGELGPIRLVFVSLGFCFPGNIDDVGPLYLDDVLG